MTTADAVFWDRTADKYARKPVEDPDAFERKIEITRARMQPEHIVLDIGCGTGSLALRLADAAAEVHGLDISEQMVRIARDKAVKQGVTNVHFHHGPFDDQFKEFSDASLDGICAYSILHLVAERRSRLEQIFRLLKPGGFFISSTVCLGNSWVPYSTIIAVMRTFGKAPNVWSIKRDQLVAEMRDAGFVNIEQPDISARSAMVSFLVASKP